MNCNDSILLALSREQREAVSRRTFLGRSASGIGLAALGGLLNSAGAAVSPEEKPLPHFAPKAKRIIYLFHRHPIA
jgi:hypothetical protein